MDRGSLGARPPTGYGELAELASIEERGAGAAAVVQPPFALANQMERHLLTTPGIDRPLATVIGTEENVGAEPELP